MREGQRHSLPHSPQWDTGAPALLCAVCSGFVASSAMGCRCARPSAQVFAETLRSFSTPLRGMDDAAIPTGTPYVSIKGSIPCGQNLLWPRLRCALAWRPVATPPVSRRCMAPLLAQLVQHCSMAMSSLALLLALLPTSSTAKKTRAAAKAATRYTKFLQNAVSEFSEAAFLHVQSTSRGRADV